MSNKLLEAAKAVSRQFREYQDVGFGDMAVLNSAIAAEEQRLADEQLPATREWLTDVISETLQSDLWVAALVSIAYPDNTVVVFCGDERLVASPTRRQVLSLLEAMGVNV